MAARKQRFQDQALTQKCDLGSSARVQPVLQAALQPARKAGSWLIESHELDVEQSGFDGCHNATISR